MPRGSTGYRSNEFYEYRSPDGQTYVLNDLGVRVVTMLDGLGMPTFEYRTSRGPYQDGETVKGMSLRPRVIQLMHRRETNSRDAYWDARDDILDIFRPNRQIDSRMRPGRFTVTKWDGTQRALDVYPEQGPSMPMALGSEGWDDFAITDTIRLIAMDPVWYDPTIRTGTFKDNCSQLVFPITFPITFCTSYIYETWTINYPGTWKSYPTITLTGPMRRAEFTNTDLDLTITYTAPIAEGTTVTIELTPTYKRAYDQAGTNMIGALTGDVGTFRIEALGMVSGGINRILVDVWDAVFPTASAVVSYYDRYIGI